MTKEAVARRLDEAGLGADRLVDVDDGAKRCTDHTHLPPERVSGNYGVRAEANDCLVLVDVDDYNGLDDKSGLSALNRLPPTLEERSPHGGLHKFYKVPVTDDGRFPAAVLEDKFGKPNLKASWGEVRVANQYVVAAGSQLDGCDKDWCDGCADDDGGFYELENDREIATVGAEELVDVLSEDPKLSPDTTEATELTDVEPQAGGETDSSGPDSSGTLDDDELDERLDYAVNDSDDEKLKALWRGDYSDYGGDRSEAEAALAMKLAFWLGGDKDAVAKAMDRADAEKWSERPDSSYRDSILSGVDKVSDTYDPTSDREKAPTYDADDVERGEQLLAAECSATDPAGAMEEKNGHYGYWNEYTDDDGQQVREFKAVTNFTLETLEHLKTDSQELLRVRVRPAHPMEDEYDVDIHPTVFNETRAFKEEIVRGKTTRYEPGKRNQTALNDLRETVGSQMVPERTGREHIGLAGDDYAEWVSPKGTMNADGLADDPEHRFVAKGGNSDSDGGALARKWELDPETLDDYDPEDVARIVELLPKTRKHDRGLSILGWFYAAPFRPLIHDWEGEFNLLQVIGSTGTGKTSTLKAYWQAFGMEPDPFSASDTPFTLMKHMASSNGVPVWIDEYKPADIRNDRLESLHRRLREVTKGTAVSKGRANLGEVLFNIKAPVVVSGEQKFSQSTPAVRRRAVMTTLSEEATREGSSYRRAFSRLTGTAYEDENGRVSYPEGYDLLDHARAYYRWMLQQSADDLKELWQSTRSDVGDLLSARGLAFEATEFQGAQTVLFGVRLFRRFAEHVGADVSQLPTDDDVADALDHFGQNIGKDGKRRGYDDAFLELVAQAAKAGYVDEDHDYRFMDSRKWGREVLAFHMPSVYAGVNRYVRDYDLKDEYNIIGKTDYTSALKDKATREGSHVLKVNHQARLEGGKTKCVVIDPQRTREKLGTDFDLRPFNRGDSEPSGAGKAAADGGETDADGGDSDERYQPPASDHSHGANAQRVARVLLERERDGQPAPTRPELMNELSNRHEHINHETAAAAIERAVEKGYVTEKGGKFEQV
jgi:hypothetical protein